VKVPDWWAATLLTLAAWRTFQLLSADDLLDTPRRYVTQRLSEYWQDFITCPYCAGAWTAGAWWIAWQLWPHGTLVVAVPFVLSAGVIASAKLLSDS
jgi:hypothetical protein